MLTVSNKGYAFVARHEGCSLTAYADTRMFASGFGVNDPTLKEGDTTTLDHAIARFTQEGQRITAGLGKLLPGVDLQQQHVDAIFCLAYNVGAGTIRDDAALIAAVKAFRASPKDARLRDLAGLEIVHTSPAGHPVPFNFSRRCHEALLFATGDYGDLSVMPFWPIGKVPRRDPPVPAPMPIFVRI